MIELIKEGTTIRLKIVGPVSEGFALPENLTCDVLIVDFEGMTRLSSIGIRAWLQWTSKKPGCKTMKLENCRSNIVDQMTRVRGMLPTYASVESFYVPFYDPETGDSHEVKMVRGKDFDDVTVNVPKPVNAEGKPLELDVLDSYFEFLKVNRRG
jgi:hypothetical protein